MSCVNREVDREGCELCEQGGEQGGLCEQGGGQGELCEQGGL